MIPSRNDLVGAKKKYHQNFLRFKKEFPTQDDLVVVVESADHEKNRQFVERLGAKLEAEPKLFHDVFYKGDPKMMGRKALLFFPEDDLRDLNQTLKDYRPFLAQVQPHDQPGLAVQHGLHAVPHRASGRRTPRTNRWSRRCRHWSAS